MSHRSRSALSWAGSRLAASLTLLLLATAVVVAQTRSTAEIRIGLPAGSAPSVVFVPGDDWRVLKYLFQKNLKRYVLLLIQ